MKILIAYDGTECSDAAIVDLRRAGLPAAVEASVLTVAEPSMQFAQVPSGAAMGGMFIPQCAQSEPSGGQLLEEAQSFAAQAADRLHCDFPGWHIRTESWLDSAPAAILRKAHAWKPDLIVVGSHGRSGIGRLVLGSVSQHVLHNVDCCVRVSRHHLHSQERAIRLVIGMDGSKSAWTAVRAVAARNWPARTEVCVVGVMDSRIAIAAAGTLDGAMPVVIEDESRSRLAKAFREAARDLAKTGLHAAHLVLEGIPPEALLAKAEKWGADCVFVGARGLNGLERFLLGSVSSVVASHAHCSVEVVRPPLD